MKVQVTYQKSSCSAASGTSFGVVVNADDTVRVLKDRIIAVEPTPFPDSELRFGIQVLDEKQVLADCGVTDGSCLSFVVSASEEAFVQQLNELLKAGALSINELGLVYCHRHGATVSEAVEAIGKDETFRAFLDRQKSFAVSDEIVMTTRFTPPLPDARDDVSPETIESSNDADASLQEWTLESQETFVEQLLDILQDQTFSINELSLLYCSRHGVPVTQVLKKLGCGRKFKDFLEHQPRLKIEGGCISQFREEDADLPLDGFTSEVETSADCMLSEETFVQQLCEVLQTQTLAINDLSLLYCTRFGRPALQILKGLGCERKLKAFLDRHACFRVVGGCVSQTMPVSQEFSGLLVMERCDRVVDAILSCLFLSVQNIVKGGLAYTGSAHGDDDVVAEIVMFVSELRTVGQSKLLNGLVQAVSCSLQDRIEELAEVQSISAVEDSMRVHVDEGFAMNVRFASAS